VFEGAYEEAMHRIRELIIHATRRDSRRIYGERRLNPDLQAAVEQSAETIVGIQKVRRDMKKLKDIIDTSLEGAEEAEDREEADEESGTGSRRRSRRRWVNTKEVEGRDDEDMDGDEARNQETKRRQVKFTKRLFPILSLLSTDTVKEHFWTTNHEQVWRELNADASHRSKVIEWLDAKCALALKIQEAYRTSKGITLGRYGNKKESHNVRSRWEMSRITSEQHGQDRNTSSSKRKQAQCSIWRQS
jgi:hypothetical protein